MGLAAIAPYTGGMANLSKQQRRIRFWILVGVLEVFCLIVVISAVHGQAQQVAQQGDSAGGLPLLSTGLIIMAALPVVLWVLAKLGHWFNHTWDVAFDQERSEDVIAHIDEVQKEALAKWGRGLTADEITQYMLLRRRNARVSLAAVGAFVVAEQVRHHFADVDRHITGS